MDISIKMFSLLRSLAVTLLLKQMLPITTRKLIAFGGDRSSLNKKKTTWPENYKNTCQNFAYKEEETLQKPNCFLLQSHKIGTLTLVQGKG